MLSVKIVMRAFIFPFIFVLALACLSESDDFRRNRIFEEAELHFRHQAYQRAGARVDGFLAHYQRGGCACKENEYFRYWDNWCQIQYEPQNYKQYEARIILPANYNDGHNSSDVHRKLRARFSRMFGGRTAFNQVSGGWIGGDGIEQDEPAVVYDIVANRSMLAQRQLCALAIVAGCGTDQEEMYLRYPSGQVVFIQQPPECKQEKDAELYKALIWAAFAKHNETWYKNVKRVQY